MCVKFSNGELTMLYLEGNLQEIVIRCQDALQVVKNAKDDHHADLGDILSDLSRAYFEMGQFSEARLAKEKAVSNDLVTYGETSHQYISGLCDLATLLRRERLGEEALKLLDKALQLVDRRPSGTRQQRHQVLIGMAKVHAVQGNLERAEQDLLQAARQLKCDQLWRSPAFARVFEFLSQLYERMGKEPAALRSIEKAIRIRRASFDMDDFRCAHMLAFQGHLQTQLGDVSSARGSYRTAIDILNRTDRSPEQVAEIEARLVKLDA